MLKPGQVYVHHYVSSTTFLLGSGAELRGQMTRQPVRMRVLLLHALVHPWRFVALLYTPDACCFLNARDGIEHLLLG